MFRSLRRVAALAGVPFLWLWEECVLFCWSVRDFRHDPFFPVCSWPRALWGAARCWRALRPYYRGVSSSGG